MRAFELTPTEKIVLEMTRQGLTNKEILARLGRKPSTGSDIISRAVEKSRLLILSQQDRRHPGAANTLGKAKGHRRMISDVRKGVWK